LGATGIVNNPLMNARRQQDERDHYDKKKDDQASFHRVPVPRAATSNLIETSSSRGESLVRFGQRQVAQKGSPARREEVNAEA
jgi:hypothetical protein